MHKKEIFLDAETIFRFLSEIDDDLDTLVLCKPSNIKLIATDQGLYEALASVENRKNVNYNKIVKLFENVEILPYSYYFDKPRKAITLERAEEIRRKAMVDGKKKVKK